jgi:hypothetical protein
MKQTAVEWLAETLRFANKELYAEMYEHIEQAKEMEKEQIVKFSKVVLKEYKWIRPEELSTIKRLYNETFNTNEK